jgi:putative addiction module component (TIGR02574 family)
MDVTLEQLEAAALSLPPEGRARLAERLLASLEDDPEVTAAWLEEVKRRNADIEEGRVVPIPAEEVFAKARAKLQ